MKKNVGKVDKTIRLVVGVALIVWGVTSSNWLGAIGIIPIATALLGWCPAYCPLNISTCGCCGGGSCATKEGK